MSKKQQKQAGFTLIEIMLAMAFIAFLLLFVVNVVMQVTRIYTKGLAVRQINQSGRQITENLSRSLRYATTPKTANGRLCVDGVSYVWNISDGTEVNKFASPHDTGINKKLLRLVSIQDSVGKYCDDPTLGLPYAESKDLIGPELTVMRFQVGQVGVSRMWDIDLIIGTAGSNIPSIIPAVPATPTQPAIPERVECDPGNNFCAFGDFSTSVYSRGG